MLTVTNRRDPVIELRAQGTLTRDDYEKVVPQLEHAAKRGPLRVLIQLEDFSGWTPKALVDDLRFDLRHSNDFEKLAVVGDTKLEEWGTRLSRPFFSGDTRFFEDEAQAREWVTAA